MCGEREPDRLLGRMLHRGRFLQLTEENHHAADRLVEQGLAEPWQTALGLPAIILTPEGERRAIRLEQGTVS